MKWRVWAERAAFFGGLIGLVAWFVVTGAGREVPRMAFLAILLTVLLVFMVITLFAFPPWIRFDSTSRSTLDLMFKHKEYADAFLLLNGGSEDEEDLLGVSLDQMLGPWAETKDSVPEPRDTDGGER